MMAYSARPMFGGGGPGILYPEYKCHRRSQIQVLSFPRLSMQHSAASCRPLIWNSLMLCSDG